MLKSVGGQIYFIQGWDLEEMQFLKNQKFEWVISKYLTELPK